MAILPAGMATTLVTVLSLSFSVLVSTSGKSSAPAPCRRVSFPLTLDPQEFYHGVAVGEPFNVDDFCDAIAECQPQLVMNWGTSNGDGNSITVCNDCSPVFLPNLWGRSFDDTNLAKLPDAEAPWGILLENEPNWWGFTPLTNDHGAGANMTATQAAQKWTGHKQLVDTKWGPGLTKWIAPSPVTDLYKACTAGQEQGCTFQGQFEWLDEYFANCNGCIKDMWALNTHEYSCDMVRTKKHITDLATRYGKNVFVGELGCDGPSAATQGQYLEDFVTWAKSEPSVVGYIWAGLNSVGSTNAQLVANSGSLTAVGTSFQAAQQIAPASS